MDNLKPFPENIKDFDIHHIKPIFRFKVENDDGSINLDELRKAFSPKNSMWMLRTEHKKINHWTL